MKYCAWLGFCIPRLTFLCLRSASRAESKVIIVSDERLISHDTRCQFVLSGTVTDDGFVSRFHTSQKRFVHLICQLNSSNNGDRQLPSTKITMHNSEAYFRPSQQNVRAVGWPKKTSLQPMFNNTGEFCNEYANGIFWQRYAKLCDFYLQNHDVLYKNVVLNFRKPY